MSVAPLQFLLLVFAGWVNRRQIEVIDYLKEKNRILGEQLGRRRLRFTDAKRRRLAVKGRAIGRRVLEQLAGLVTPDMILRWYRELIAKKYGGSSRRQCGCSSTADSLQRLVVRFVTENPSYVKWAEMWIWADIVAATPRRDRDSIAKLTSYFTLLSDAHQVLEPQDDVFPAVPGTVTEVPCRSRCTGSS
jgi:hypothetical protein